MKRYLITILFAAGIIMLFRVYPMRLYTLNLPQIISDRLFNLLRNDPMPDESIIILNSASLPGSRLKTKVDSLLMLDPKVIGINLCDIEEEAALLAEAYRENPKVVLGICSPGHDPLSRIIYDDNVVTHFRTDREDYFEFKISDAAGVLKNRGNELERINYYGSFGMFPILNFNLDQVGEMYPEVFKQQIVLIGYCGEIVSGEEVMMGVSEEKMIRDYKHSRITPMNLQYGYDEASADMHDIAISANIIRMINEQNFINEIGPVTRVSFILACAMLLVLLITVIRTKWLLLNLLLYFVCYSLIIIGATLLIVVAFDNNYYLELPELSIVLTVIGIFTVIYNLASQKKNDQPAT